MPGEIWRTWPLDPQAQADALDALREATEAMANAFWRQEAESTKRHREMAKGYGYITDVDQDARTITVSYEGATNADDHHD